MDLIIERGIEPPKRSNPKSGNEYIIGEKIWNELPLGCSTKVIDIDPKILRVRLFRLSESENVMKQFSIVKEKGYGYMSKDGTCYIQGYRVFRLL